MADDKINKIKTIIDGDKGNINLNDNVASTGMNLDNSINQIAKGQLTYALNASVENFDSNSVSYQNEQGNEFCLQFPQNYVLVGNHLISEKNKHIFFITNPVTGDSEIGYMDNNDCIYRTLTNALCLNFNIQYPIHKIVHKITNCKTEIYWTDGYNPRRYMDIENVPYKLSDSSTLCDPLFTNILDCNQIKLQPNFTIPELKIVDTVTGGSITAGTIQFAIQYSDAQSNPYTSYYSITNPTPIADTFLTTVNFNYPVGKSVVVEINNLDITGQFQYFNLAVIKTVNDITSTELVGTYFIDNSTQQITYTGQIVDNIRLSMGDIFEKYPYYEIANDLTAVQDVLVWDGLTSIDRINYQSIASQITLQWETYKIPSTENYSNELNATNLRSYLRDEVYAFEIVFLLANGKQTDGFHIPGRVATLSDLVLVDSATNDDFIGEPSIGTTTSPYWKIYNTASVTGNAVGLPIGNATPYQYGDFAYWESSEKYPCNVNIWGELADQPIRHHKFPDVAVSPIYESALFTGTGLNNMVMQNDAVYPIGVKIDSSQIESLIRFSTLTTTQQDDIVGYKILRGDRSTNRSIVAKGILRNVGKYTREEEDFIYPNYPYNDLEPDRFINVNNNAWSKISNPYNIYVLKFNAPLTALVKTYLEIEFTDPNTNKKTKHKFKTLGKQLWCSITRPIVLGPGIVNNIFQTNNGPKFYANNIAVVEDANYDVYTMRHRTGHAGFTAQWNDAIVGTTTIWVPGWLGEGYTDYTVHVMPGTVPLNISTKWDDITHVSDVRVESCATETPLPSIATDTNLPYRQIFNSPETSFGQPFLGNVLKLEQVMYGAGKAHFTEVRNNAKYRLLTAEAQKDAFHSSYQISSIIPPYDPVALFSAYQAYLTIYVNGITRKNYAYSFNSRANYDYSASIPNGLGIKQRPIDTTRYLIPGIQNVGDTINNRNININNYQRETSVYIKTKGTDGTITALPFPSNSVNIPADITDKSRFTISDIGACSVPAKEQDISVVSYYASMKNIFINQWGQIYSYKTIDTGFQQIFNSSSIKNNVVFGGDTFISRFAFKTKLPFFIDNRVNGLDDSDVFYDELGNIAYPKYWHSARSILENYDVMTNFISYKAHNFDCKNNQEPKENNPDRTFYDGYFYLFAYGIPNFYCESSYNTDLRQAFNNREGDFWPHVSNGIPDDWLQESFVSIQNDNTYNYNVTYSKQNKENYFSHLPFDWDSTCYTVYPFRAIYSNAQQTDVDNKVNNWLTYGPLSYFDFPQNYGKLISLDGIQNKAVLARFENKSLMYDNLLTIDTSNPQAAYMGNPLMFRKSPPIDFAETDLGYVGSQNKLLLKIPNGQLTIDAKRGQIFLIEGTQAIDISAFGSGMNRFFTDHLAFEILRYFPTVDTDNHFNGIGLHAMYDSKFDRIIITKLDYTPLDKNIKYYTATKEFYLEEEQSNGVIIKTQVYLSDKEFFCNKSWTVSFNVNTKSWVSFHSYLPNFYIAENNFFYSGLNGCCTDLEGSFEAIVGDTNKPIMTTTTTTLLPVTTTTSTTIFIDCELSGRISATYCNIEGNAIITIPPTPTTTLCQRSDSLPSFYLITGYTVNAEPTVVSTGSYDDACNTMAFLLLNTTDDIVVEFDGVMSTSLDAGSVIYKINGSLDCTLQNDGWYFTDESSSTNTVYHIESGVITELFSCNCETTTTTTTAIPNVSECCGTLFASGDNIYYYNSIDLTMNLLNVPGYVASVGIAMTANYLWSLDVAGVKQWDITLAPFSATYNRLITIPLSLPVNGGIVAKDENTLITSDITNSPVDIVELDITGVIAVVTTMFSLQINRTTFRDMLYTTDGKLIVINQDNTTLDYYITQYDYSTGVMEYDANIGTFSPTSIFECECSLFLTDVVGKVYIFDRSELNTILEINTLGVPVSFATQVGSCIVSALSNSTTTTTTTL